MRIASRTQVYTIYAHILKRCHTHTHTLHKISRNRIKKIVHTICDMMYEKGGNKRKSRVLFSSSRNFIFIPALDIFFPAVFLFALRSFPLYNFIFSRFAIASFPVIHISNLFLLLMFFVGEKRVDMMRERRPCRFFFLEMVGVHVWIM